ncbi:MAG: PLP-dependent transferase, partial [Candidatus Lokiarchaeota archaeon]|nr:PLP-dependent transferase [Candidatus Lokiarchaeota archaeon]
MEEERKTPDRVNKELREKWDQWRFDTQQVRAGEDPYPSTTHSLRTPIYATKSYTYSTMSEMLKNNYFYSRTENPTLYALDKKLATLHGGEEALSVASGMAAVHLSLSSVFQDRLDRMKPRKIEKYYPQNNPTHFP